MTTHRRPWPAIALALAVLPTALAVSACAATATGSFARILSVAGPVELEVTTGSGDITVRTGDASSVQVKGIIRVGSSWGGLLGASPEEKVRRLEANPPIVQAGNVIRIGRIEDEELRRNVSISYEIVTPVETRLRSETGSGDQVIDGLRGPVKAETGSGSLKLSRIGGEVRANTGSGDVELTAINGSVSADTGSGSIQALGIAGAFTGDTGSGDVHLQQTAPGPVKVDTGSGNVELSGVRGPVVVDTGSGDITVAGQPGGEWKLEAGSGNITVRVPAQAAFDLHVQTDSGRITLDHPVTVQGVIGRTEVRGKVQGGGVLIEVKTGSGNIRVE